MNIVTDTTHFVNMRLIMIDVHVKGAGTGQGLLSRLACQAGDLQDAMANHIQLFGWQGAFLNLCDTLHFVHRPDDADRHLDPPFGKRIQVITGADQELPHLIIGSGATEEIRQGGR